MSMGMQFYNDLIVIDSWRPDPVYDGMFPKGAREKAVYFSPDKPEQDCIKSDWRHLFKLPRSIDWCPWQFWVEVIAYRLGYLIGVPVPPAHAALSREYQSGKETYGALIEWFYNERKDVYIEGGQVMTELIENYDRKKGKQHNWQTVCESFAEDLKRWTGVFILDSLIGNTDRHHDNWGLVIKGARIGLMEFELGYALAFDNGTALGYEIREKDFVKYRNKDKLTRYLTDPQHARHHMKWSLDEKEPINFFDFVKKLIVQSPEIKPIIEKHLSFFRPQVEEILVPLLEMVTDERHRLTEARLDFMLDLILQRKALLEEVLI